MKQLPNKPSELILLALKDLSKAERLKGYTVDMGVWHRPKSEWVSGRDTCKVCFAGSVMAFSLKADKTLSIGAPNLDIFGKENRNKFLFLNMIRGGSISAALLYLDITLPIGMSASMSVEDYRVSRKHFKRDMRAIVKELQEFNL
jgi:hypothetical protein